MTVAVDWPGLGLDPRRARAVNAETGAEIPVTEAGLAIPVLRRDFAAVLIVQPERLEPGESLRATFDWGVEADEALGCERFPGAQERVADDQGGMALAVGDRDVLLWGHLHLR